MFTRTGDDLVGNMMLVAPASGPLSESAAGASELGTSVAMSADGDTVLAGGPKDGAGGSRGAAWVFARSGRQLARGRKAFCRHGHRDERSLR